MHLGLRLPLLRATILEVLGNSWHNCDRCFNVAGRNWCFVVAGAIGSAVVLLLVTVYVLFFGCHTLIHSICCSNSHISGKAKTKVARFTPHQIPFGTLTSQVMRMRPVVPLGVPHGVVEEVEVSGWRLPKATMVMPLHWAINRSNSLLYSESNGCTLYTVLQGPSDLGGAWKVLALPIPGSWWRISSEQFPPIPGFGDFDRSVDGTFLRAGGGGAWARSLARRLSSSLSPLSSGWRLDLVQWSSSLSSSGLLSTSAFQDVHTNLGLGQSLGERGSRIHPLPARLHSFTCTLSAF